ncbi:hypothetical protein ACFQ21_02655 [Ohtaekwangia kribbensis]|uniref:Uncharacterized protein n=1 Tax=Ohtaekwangia kribbensis TaxID=688913 RepID=A0ABW3JX73_9BACT
MSIHSDHPKYPQFFRNELRTLNVIASNTFLVNKFRNLTTIADRLYHAYKGYKDKELLIRDFKFHVDFDIEIEKQQRRIVIEAGIRSQYSMASYVLSICEKNTPPYSIIRKFHFDYALPVAGDSRPKPVYHLQYGGEQSPQLAALGIDVGHLHPWLSLPRINYAPMNLALLLDMVFCEFRTADTVHIIEDSKWREHIKLNEDFLLRPYYLKVNGFVNHDHKVNSLIRDFNYGR